MDNFIGIILLSTLIEGLITYLFGKTSENMPPRPWLKYVSLGLGVLASIAYKIDILALVGLSSFMPVVGYVMSGLIIGRGSNYLNDILTLVKGQAAASV